MQTNYYFIVHMAKICKFGSGSPGQQTRFFYPHGAALSTKEIHTFTDYKTDIGELDAFTS